MKSGNGLDNVIEPMIMKPLQREVLACLLFSGPLLVGAQQQSTLYDFDSVKYRVVNWHMNGMMHVLMEKYGAEYAGQRQAIDSLVARINDGSATSDAMELANPSTMAEVRNMLGYYPGIDAEAYGNLAQAAKGKDVEGLEDAIDTLLALARRDTGMLRDTLAELDRFHGIGLDSLVSWLKVDEAARTNHVLSPEVDRLGKATKVNLLGTCKAEMAPLSCRAAVQQVLEGARAKAQGALELREEAMATWAKGGKDIMEGYTQAMKERTKVIRAQYAVAPWAIDSLVMKCTTGDGQSCTKEKDEIVGALNVRKESVSREFSCAMPLADHRSFFIKVFSDALLAIAEDEVGPAGRLEAERLAEVNFYRLLTQVLTAPVPNAGELCANRELMIHRRLTRAQVWAQRKGYLAGKRHPGIVIKGRGKARLYRNPDVSLVLARVKLKGSSDTTDWGELRSIIQGSQLLSSRFRADPYLNPYQLTIVSRRRYAAIHAPRLLRHHVTNAKGILAMDDHDRFPFAVNHVVIKFEDGVIEAIVVDGEVTEEFRFAMVADGNHSDSVLLHHHYKTSSKDEVVCTTRRSKVTFTNSNTPIPFGNVWNFYERFVDRMPLYGYSQGSGVSYHGTSQPDYVLFLSDLLHFEPSLQRVTSNIAPGDTVITIDFRRETENGSSAGSGTVPSNVKVGPGNPGVAKGAAGNSSLPARQLCAGLRKDDLRKIGEFRVYTDLVGLARNQPNGLLQSEYAWRIPLKPRVNQGVNFVPFVEPQFTLVLHEAEEQRAFLGFDTAAAIGGKRIVDPLNLLANNMYRVGVKVTLVQLSMRYLNSEFELNPICAYTRTMARDSVPGSLVRDSVQLDSSGSFQSFDRATFKHRDLDGIGQFTYGTELRWRMRTDDRFGFDLYGGVAWHSLLSSTFGVNKDGWATTGILGPNMIFAGLDAHLLASPSQRFFFKFRWIANRYQVEDHYTQLMFGYSRNLRFSREDDEKRKAADNQIKTLLTTE